MLLQCQWGIMDPNIPGNLSFYSCILSEIAVIDKSRGKVSQCLLSFFLMCNSHVHTCLVKWTFDIKFKVHCKIYLLSHTASLRLELLSFRNEYQRQGCQKRWLYMISSLEIDLFNKATVNSSINKSCVLYMPLWKITWRLQYTHV